MKRKYQEETLVMVKKKKPFQRPRSRLGSN